MTETKRRFIAGAVCPKCAQMDKIVTYREGEKNYRECVSCGFKEVLNFTATARELETRVNVTEQQKKEQTQVLNFPPRD